MTCKSLQDQSFVISESEVLKLIVIYAEGYKIFFLNEKKYKRRYFMNFLDKN